MCCILLVLSYVHTSPPLSLPRSLLPCPSPAHSSPVPPPLTPPLSLPRSQVFFVVLLQPPQVGTASPLPATTDPDQLISCDLMDGRDAFLTMSRERHWEFSSLRRAKYSTMAMLYELHNQTSDRFVYTCNHCRMHVETRYHCRECDVSHMQYLCYLVSCNMDCFSLNGFVTICFPSLSSLSHSPPPSLSHSLTPSLTLPSLPHSPLSLGL